MNTKVVMFNGPPRSGKDAGAYVVMEEFQHVKHLRFSDALKRMATGFLKSQGVTDARCHELLYNPRTKDEPAPEFFGDTPRQFQIWLSEQCLKKQYGDYVFGRLVANRITEESSPRFVISDSGFKSEVEALVMAYPGMDYLFIRVHRPGHEFTNDSRSYFEPPKGVLVADIINDGTLWKYRDKVRCLVKDFFDGKL